MSTMPFRSLKVTSKFKQDYNLAKRVLIGDPSAKNEFSLRLGKIPVWIRSIAKSRRIVLRLDDIDDIAQEATLTALRRLPTFHGHARLETWLYSICSFELINHMRKKNRLDRVLRNLFKNQISKAQKSKPMPINEDHQLGRALKDLKPQQSEVVQRYLLKDASFLEIAKQLKTPVNTVRSQYYRGIATLRARFLHNNGSRPRQQ